MSQAAGYVQKIETPASAEANRRLVAGWLFVVAAMIWVMVGIGGYTRDSGSGLSIMDWDPIMGTLPPLSDAAWNKLFALYQTIPQAHILHHGMDLAGFKTLFWPEYIHRLWGRLIGVAVFVPLVVFILTRRIETRLIPWLGLLFVLGGLQGAIGWLMVGIGGYTRDSGSGLSIMDWDPIMGTLPPLSDAAWNKVFALYQTIPQAQILHHGMDLAGFKTLFWPEYIHRLWGRLIGVAVFVPLVVFILTRRIETRLIPWLGLLFVLGGLQGAIGWLMVSSGFDPNSVAVAPWLLTMHFSAAMLLFIAIFWTALTVLRPQRIKLPGLKGVKIASHVAVASLAVAMFAGTFVSGTEAVKAFNPAAGVGVGQPPPGYPFVNFYTNKAAILFNHQTLATLTVIAVLTVVVMALRNRATTPRVRDAALAMGFFVLLQFGLGVSALVSQAMDLGVAHQMDAVLLLSSALYMMHSVRGAVR